MFLPVSAHLRLSSLLTELSEWKELVETYSREAAEDLQKTVNAYNEKKTAAQARRDSAQNAVGESKRPVLEELQKEKEVAETEYLEKEKIYNQLHISLKVHTRSTDIS